MFNIIYPEKRRVDDKTISVWYADAVANGEIENVGAETPAEKALALHKDGLITLAANPGKVAQFHLEPSSNGEDWCLCQDGIYEESSVLAGETFSRKIRFYNSLEEAIAANPGVEVLEQPIYRVAHELPHTPPAWFDPSYAGETWDDDY